MKKEGLKELGEKLKSLRESKGLSQAKLSEIMQTSADAYGMYEKGKREPTLSKLKKVAEFFNTSIDKLALNNSTIQKIFWADIGYTVKTLDSGIIELILPSAGMVVDESSVVTVKGVERKIIFPSVDSFINFSTDIQRKFKSDYISRINEELLLRYHKIEEGETKDLRIEEKPFIKSFVPMKS